MAVAVGDVFLATFEGIINDQVIMLTLTYEVATLAGATDEALVSADLAQRLSAAGADVVEGDYLACLGTNYTLDYIHAQKVYPERFRRETEPRGVPGTGEGAANTQNIAMVISLHAAQAGRSYVANKHIGPIPTVIDAIEFGKTTPNQEAAQIALRNALLLDVTAAGWYSMKPCIYHRAAVIPKSDYITGGIILDTVRVMRRRTVRLGI